MVTRLLVAVSLVFVCATSLFAQSVPVVAKVRQTGETMRNGKVVERHVIEEMFYRNSEGLELTLTISEDGREVQGKRRWGNLNDKIHGINYHVDYINRMAYRQLPHVFSQHALHGTRESNTIGFDQVQGISCRILPMVQSMGAPVDDMLIGRSCWSPDYHLTLRQDFTVPDLSSSGITARNLRELYDIQIGVEPDPSLFDLKSNMTVIPEPEK